MFISVYFQKIKYFILKSTEAKKKTEKIAFSVNG